jgi:hypothetical protein
MQRFAAPRQSSYSRGFRNVAVQVVLVVATPMSVFSSYRSKCGSALACSAASMSAPA